MTELTVSIVNFNAGKYLIECLDSLYKLRDKVLMEIFVIDNVSTDGSLEEAKKRFPKVNFIENDKNLGFGKAHNQILRNLKTKYVLILNPDSKVLSGTLKYLLNYMNVNTDVGIASCKLEKTDGSIDWASHRGFPTPWASFLYYFLKNDKLYHLTDKDMTKSHEVDSVVGAFMFIRKEVFDKIGFFDEDYFLYAEDIDLCYRAKRAGFKVMYIPEIKAIHLKGISSGIKSHSQQISPATLESKLMALNSFYKTMILFYKKHLEKNYPFFVNWFVYSGINLKWFLAKRSLRV